MSQRVQSNRVLVTAGASGIGLAIAQRFIASGAQVYICDLDRDTLERALEENPGTRGSVADVGNASEVDCLFEEAMLSLGGIDTLINNAGIGGPNAPIDEMPDDAWDKTIQVNLNGAFYCAKRAAKLMKSQGAGNIISISSTSARTGLPNRAPYVASKVGLEGLTRNLARELGPFGIRCNAVLPGSMENERGRALLQRAAERDGISFEEAKHRRLQYVSMRTRILPSEIADMVHLLTTHEFRHVSGQSISVCGNVEWEG